MKELRARRRRTAAVVLALALPCARPARPRPPPAPPPDLHLSADVFAPPVASTPTPPDDAPGHGERTDLDGVQHLGPQPARGVLTLPAATPPRSLSLWPPAPLWPSVAHGALRVEHALLRPTTPYLLDLAWDDGHHERLAFVTEPLAEVLRRGPEIGRIDPATDVWFTLGADADRPSVERSFRMEPPVEGALTWTDDRTARFRPARPLALGVLHRVHVGGLTRDGAPLHPATWTFRTLIPPPLHITPGEDAPVVFTFDDGTHDLPQAWALLDLLREHDVKAIFFPTGRWTRSHPDYIARALADGHRLCNHSETHARLPRLTDAQIEREIVRGAGHGSCTLLRPPAMDSSARVERIARSLGYQLYFWDVDSRDWEGLPAEDIRNRVLARVSPESVLLFHMHALHTLEALPPLFAALREAGYRLTYEGARKSPARPDAPLPDDPLLAPPP